MGIIYHKAIIVTGWKDDYGNENHLEKAYNKSFNIFKFEDDKTRISTTNIAGFGMNGYKSFMICPCGSKLGWSLNQEYEDMLEKYIRYLNTLVYDDGSSQIDWVMVEYGETKPKILDSNYSY